MTCSNQERPRSSLLLVRHVQDEDDLKYRVKSNALLGLAISTSGAGTSHSFGWASFTGRTTYLEPGMLEPEGNYEFTAYVEGHGEPGSAGDRFWLETRDKDGNRVEALSMQESASVNAVGIDGGNLVAPHDGEDLIPGNLEAVYIPEPGAIETLAAGIVLLMWLRRRTLPSGG